jgi:hypothetical protein
MTGLDVAKKLAERLDWKLRDQALTPRLRA